MPLHRPYKYALRAALAAGIVFVTTLVSVGMPPDDAGRDGITNARDWWSLRPVIRPAVPPLGVIAFSGCENPIDAFLAERLVQKGLKPSAAASREVLLRRATFDLIGLPPSPEEIDAFVADDSPDAYERLIDRLLASPRYGERWARHWLDVARFGESQGFERDIIRDHSWRYRDYVIQSFNRDVPYDQFIKQQIAGDVLAPNCSDGIVATGFLVAGPYDEAGNSSKSELLRSRIREEELEDIIGTVGQTFLGLTVHCARCHDHKFDPIPQRDYYRLKAVFGGIRHGNRPALPPDQLAMREQLIQQSKRAIDDLERQIAALERIARLQLLETQLSLRPTGPVPIACWSFETDACDQFGQLHGTLHGGAKVVDGRLRLNGKDAFVETTPLSQMLESKTLEVWGRLSKLSQRGGGLIAIETIGGAVFDAVVFGEREPRKWIAGSEGYHRTKDLAGALEPDEPADLVQIAITYDASNTITVYRNGVRYAEPYVPSGTDGALRPFIPGQSHIVFGLRHTGAGNGFFAGEIEEARLYDRALGPDDIAESFRVGVPRITIDQVVAELNDEQRESRAAMLAERERLRVQLDSASVPQVYAANPRPAESTHILLRGDVERPAELVTPGGLSCVSSVATDMDRLDANAPEADRRIQFAGWLADPANPLTARVMVNRIWHHHFGRGLAASPSDFGRNGEPPTHPELLDWLASEFVAMGWSVKAMHKRIMLSRAYRQDSRFDAEAAAIDADDRLLWRFPARRLEGEVVRDAMLKVSGQLNGEMGGPSFRPFELKIFNSHFYNLNDPVGPEYDRRTIYRIHVNSAKDPLLDSMDCPDPSTKTPVRNVTTTPIQALSLMNNTFVQRQTSNFAARIATEAGTDPVNQIRLAYRLALGRLPTAAETSRAVELANEQGIDSVCWALLNASEFQYLK